MNTPISLLCDSESAYNVAMNKVYNGKKRNIHIRHGALRYLVKHGVVAFEQVRTKNNIADPFTKGLNGKLVFE